jgi:hypothetical protein
MLIEPRDFYAQIMGNIAFTRPDHGSRAGIQRDRQFELNFKMKFTVTDIQSEDDV